MTPEQRIGLGLPSKSRPTNRQTVHWAQKLFVRTKIIAKYYTKACAKLNMAACQHKCDILLVIISNIGPVWAISHRFWDTTIYLLKIAYFSYPSLI